MVVFGKKEISCYFDTAQKVPAKLKQFGSGLFGIRTRRAHYKRTISTFDHEHIILYIMPAIDPRQLNDLASLASRGGLGRGVACVDFCRLSS